MTPEQRALLSNTAQRCVQAGLLRLLTCEEVDWSRYDPATMRMNSTSDCLLAQLFAGSYARGRRALGLENNEDAANHGFWWHKSVPSTHIRDYYLILSHMWRTAIERERGLRQLADMGQSHDNA